MSCPTCPHPATPAAAPEPPATATPEPRSGACVACLRKHLLKAAGYAAELEEEPGRAWESNQLQINLMLAEDHARALGLLELRQSIRAERLRAEAGGPCDIDTLSAKLPAP